MIPPEVLKLLEKGTTAVLVDKLTSAQEIAVAAANCGSGRVMLFRAPRKPDSDATEKRPNALVALISGVISDADLDRIEDTLRGAYQDVTSDGDISVEVERDYRSEKS